MKDIGIRELKTRASAIARRVREKGEHYVVTCRGRPVGVLCPLEDAPASDNRSRSSAWDELIALGDKISAGWRSKKSAAEILSEMRR